MVNLNRTVADVIDTNIPHWAALTAVTTDAENGAYAPGVTTGTLTVTLHEDEDVRSWLNQEGATDPNDKLEGAYAEYACSTVLGASMDGGKTIIPLYIAPDGSQMVGKLEFPVSTEDDVTHVVEFFELQDGKPITSGEEEDAKPVPFFGIYTSFVAQQAVFLGEGDVTFTTPADWPEEGQRVFGDQLTAPFTLSFIVEDQSATWKDTSKVTIRDSEGKLVDEDAHFLWESSNPQVATINSTTDLAAIDQGAYAGQITMDLAAYAKSDPENYMENGEIRSGGIAVYLKAWVEDSDNQVAELFTNNNVKSCNLQSLLELSDGEQVTVSSQVTYGADSTTVVPTLQNNSIQQKTSGYLIVDLLDESGNVIASQQTYTLENGTPTGLIQLDGESVATVQPITFNQKGAGAAYRFGESQTEASTGLTEIALSQIPLRMEDGAEAEGITTFQVTAGASLTETTLTVLQEYLPATVTVNGKPYDVNDIASRTFSLPVGTTTLDIVVTSGDKTHTYRVEITRPSTGGGTGGGGSTRYPIIVPEEDHGTVSVSPSRASSGQTVTITVTPDEGYKVGSVTVKRPNGSTVPVTGQGNGKYIFTMPSGGVTVDVTFIPEDWPFVDVTEDKWYYDAVAYVYQQGIMVGMSETTFEPNTTVNRAQVVQMLYNLEGQPQVSGDSGFSDIRDGQWYAKAVAWASANDVVAGYEDGTFRPTRAVTREEFAQILYNYAKCKGYGLSASADLGQFPDAGQVSSWAETALGWANGNGLINGHDDGRLDPKGSTIRAQAASILMNFDKGFAQEG